MVFAIQCQPRNPQTPQIPNSGIKLHIPRNPTYCPRLNAPNPPRASAVVNIESRFVAICPDQNAGHDECTIGELSCIGNCELVETTISTMKTLQTAATTITRRHSRDAPSQLTANPRNSIGIAAPAYRGPKARPAFHQ